jgi:hypothetical protein
LKSAFGGENAKSSDFDGGIKQAVAAFTMPALSMARRNENQCVVYAASHPSAKLNCFA